MNHEIEAHFAQYCYLLKSEDDAPGWSFAAEHADNRGIAIQMLSTYINNKRRLLPDMSPEYVNGLIENNIVNVFRKTDAYKDYPYDNSRGVEFDFENLSLSAFSQAFTGDYERDYTELDKQIYDIIKNGTDEGIQTITNNIDGLKETITITEDFLLYKLESRVYNFK